MYICIYIRDGLLVTLRTLQLGLVETIHVVHNDGIVPQTELVPSLLGELAIRSTLVVLSLHVGLLLDAIQVLMQTIQQVGDELLRIVLLVALKLRLELPQHLLEGEGWV